MTTYFSATTRGFYTDAFKSDYDAAGTWPADAVEVTDAQWKEYTGAAPDGYMLGTDLGKPAWVLVPAPTTQELIALAESKKAQLKNIADSEISWRQDAVDAEIATDDEIAALSEWKKYRVLLMRVDTLTAPGITWPEQPTSRRVIG